MQMSGSNEVCGLTVGGREAGGEGGREGGEGGGVHVIAVYTTQLTGAVSSVIHYLH